LVSVSVLSSVVVLVPAGVVVVVVLPGVVTVEVTVSVSVVAEPEGVVVGSGTMVPITVVVAVEAGTEVKDPVMVISTLAQASEAALRT
jgi:hypothetical protein